MESIVQILGILTVLSVARMQGDRLQVKAAVKIDGSHDVPFGVQHKRHESNTNAGPDSSLLKSRDQTAAGLGSTGSRSWRSRSDSSAAIRSGRASRSAVGLVSSVTRRGQLVVAAGERERTRSNEALGLIGVGGVSVDGIHFCDFTRWLFVNRTRDVEQI